MLPGNNLINLRREIVVLRRPGQFKGRVVRIGSDNDIAAVLRPNLQHAVVPRLFERDASDGSARDRHSGDRDASAVCGSPYLHIVCSSRLPEISMNGVSPADPVSAVVIGSDLGREIRILFCTVNLRIDSYAFRLFPAGACDNRECITTPAAADRSGTPKS